MSVSSTGAKGQPEFASTGNTPTFAADLSAVSTYAALVGNTVVGTTAERTAFAEWEGLFWYDTDLSAALVYDGTDWVELDQAPETGSFSAVSSVDLQTVFEANRHYRVILRVTAASGASTVTARLMSGASANSASAYTRQAGIFIDASPTASRSINGTSWLVAAGTGRPLRRITIDLDQVADAQPTSATMLGTERDAGLTDFGHLSYGLYHSASTAFDGIQFTASTGTITGTWEVVRLG